jgi:RHS repeat-associated protein
MLTRTDADGTTRFEWDGFDCIRELAPATGSAVFDTAQFDSAEFGSSGRTDYYVVNGQLRQLVRDETVYTVTSDALGCVRLVVDEAGTVVCSFDYEPWGQFLPSSVDDMPGGMPYRYVGAYGCRYDADTGLTHMRARWYDPTLQRFISRDPKLFGVASDALPMSPHSTTPQGYSSAKNLYAYANNNPATLVDPTGKEAAEPCSDDYITNKMCRAACDRLDLNKSATQICYRICKGLTTKSCNGLFQYCDHIARHGSEFGKRMAEICVSLYYELCPGR